MIIKSMARKRGSFRQLLGYIHAPECDAPVLTHNLYAAETGYWQEVAHEFEENSAYLPFRRNGNSLYHEVIALNRLHGISRKEQARLLLQMAKYYLALRAPSQLAYGRIHDNTDHLHIHLVISSNAPRSAKRERISKADFRLIQAEVERYQIEHFPQLGTERVYGEKKDQSRVKVRAGEYQAARREGVLSQKEILRSILVTEFSRYTSFDALKNRLSVLGYVLYQRGQGWGVEDQKSGRRHRLKTLGLQEDFQLTLTRFSLFASRRVELSNLQLNYVAHENLHQREAVYLKSAT